ncbi:hypothetical protein [Phenylobacterium sp.]|jgi:hypothetical protein|uniref:hypothetical protein n=1 Tax=Phenylobacterium sp. TaxID=1871053 RepID=UPI002E30702A|nr:hypothetical protein [Phenylobacterium sp.]HEX4711570.1 hypothetical protein [Phenylobacterium sp.]
MLKTNLIVAAVAALLFAGSASAQKLDANGRCHDASGKFAKAEVCGGATTTTGKTTTGKTSKSKGATSATSSAKPASATTAAAPAAAPAAATTKSQKCKNDQGKFAKCGSPGAHPA